ncbi:type II toxin-antitoxin system HipA family toxin [Paraburkholderia guartelaensis]|uniref:Type II toxin-antitoxin system HipA family toxin n=1 Tax=Paraburkholderia guartelaensis TaxID=2546446 RepID=A0A4V2ZVB9_9BURK|nr:type II toxin-antitoxin system HipA family toxin [Paraburkholderia guartelaensis]TDG04226.1 type II toxin-antitoxin system HipA family toxin [Paraburkholderia guartelaensis]
MTASASFDLERLLREIRNLEVHTPQGPSGLLARESRFVFNYGDAPDTAAVSLTMPVRRQSYASGDLMGIFAMNRPEGYLRFVIEERLARYGAPSDMFLLFLAGTNQIGRLTYSVPGERVPQSDGERLDELLSSPSGRLFERLIDRYALGSGISGVQPKAVVPLAAENASRPAEHTALPLRTVIVKAEGDDFPGLARNEYFCMSVAKEAALEVPDFWLSEDGKLFVMSRFDREANGTPLGFEDMSVLTGKAKYEGSYEMIAKAVDIYTRSDPAQKHRLFERIALSCLLRDGDAHMKNLGILYIDPTGPRRLAPVFDVVCTDIYPDLDGRMALSLNRSKTFPLPAELHAFARRLGLRQAESEAIMSRLHDAYLTVAERFSDDPRFHEGDLLARIRRAVERPGVKPVSRPKLVR